MLTEEETLQVVIWMTNFDSSTLIQREFEKMFNRGPPSQNAILDLYTKFKENQSGGPDRISSQGSIKNCELLILDKQC